MTKMFEPQLGRSIEVYIDDMVVKSKVVSKHVGDLTNIFEILKKHKFVEILFCNPYLTSHEGQKGNFTLKIYILILAIRSLISFHQNDLDVVTVKSTGHKP